MNFYTWMMKKHINTKAPVGDLARDMKDDREFPRDGDKAVIRDYLEGCGACSGCMDAFERAWRKYEREAGGAETGSGCKGQRRNLSKVRITGI